MIIFESKKYNQYNYDLTIVDFERRVWLNLIFIVIVRFTITSVKSSLVTQERLINIYKIIFEIKKYNQYNCDLIIIEFKRRVWLNLISIVIVRFTITRVKSSSVIQARLINEDRKLNDEETKLTNICARCTYKVTKL